MDFYLVRRKNPLVKRNRWVLYDGQLMRIANTSGDGLKLRREILCHANDEGLVIEPSLDYFQAIEMLDSAVEMIISNGGEMWDMIDDSESFDKETIIKTMRMLIRTLNRNLERLSDYTE